MKRSIDFIFSFLGILIFSFNNRILILIWLQDFHNPFYFANRVGKNLKFLKWLNLGQ